MDLTTPNTTPNTSIPDTESETPPQTQHIKPLSFTNGAVKKNHHHDHPQAPAMAYKECLKNHAANLGGHALDGCGEFMPSPTSTPTDPTSLKCAACGGHRNFHRREPNESTATTHFLEFHHSHPPPPRRTSPSPPPPPQPIPPTKYSYAPHMLLALSTAVVDDQQGATNHHHQIVATPGTPTAMKTENPSGRKRFRTKFSQEQKEKMHLFAEKLGWKMQRCDEGMVEEFCKENGIRRGILKVWMHNNKNTFGKREKDITMLTNNNDNNSSHHHNNGSGGGVHLQASTNGSSSSS